MAGDVEYALYHIGLCHDERNIFTVVEYVQGNNGYLLSVEWGVYVFDAALMALMMAWFFRRYPSKVKLALASKDRIVSMDDMQAMNVQPRV